MQPSSKTESLSGCRLSVSRRRRGERPIVRLAKVEHRPHPAASPHSRDPHERPAVARLGMELPLRRAGSASRAQPEKSQYELSEISSWPYASIQCSDHSAVL